MNIQTSRDYPTKPADFIDRGAEMMSRIVGVVAFAVAIFALLYMLAD
jgi:hypothetical protein